MESLRVSLFGGFQLHRGDRAVPPMGSRTARSLFAFLAVHRGVRHPRERLSASFWPDLPPARARRRLSHTLWQVQDALTELDGEAAYLEVTADTLAFDPQAPATVDVEVFELGLDRMRARRTGAPARVRDLTDLEATVALYRGEFMAGHPDEWVVAEQERLHQRYLEALGWLVGIAKGHGAHEDALVYARRLANEDPLREDAHREVMRLCVLLGRTAEAVRQYERCVEVLADELGTAPSAGTTGLYQRIVRRPQATSPDVGATGGPVGARLPLIGRDRERDAVVTVLERALGGRGGAVLVEGVTGIGITRLLSEVVDDAHWRTFVTAEAACRRVEIQAPYTLLREVFAELLTPLRVEQLRSRAPAASLAVAAEVIPQLARVAARGTPVTRLRDGEGAERLREVLIELLTVLSEVDPVLVVLDDAQWCDPESLAVLTGVAAAATRRRLVVVLGYRGDEARTRPHVWSSLRALDRRARPERVLLEPLDPFSTGEIVRLLARGHAIGTSAVHRLQHETGGNPLFLVETIRALADEDRLADLDEDGPLPLPGSIRAIVQERLRVLTHEPRQVLELAAIAGDGVDVDTLAAASDLPREVVVDAADVLVRRALLVQSADALALPHDQVRRVAIDELSHEAARALHRRVAASLEQHHPDEAGRLAHHYREADMPAAAAEQLHRAARAAVRVHAYVSADVSYRAAVEQRSRVPASVESRFELLAEHEAVLDVLGERREQAAVLDELAVLASGDAWRRTEVERRRGLLAGHLGDLATASEHADAAVDGAATRGDDGQLAQALVAQASVLTWSGRRTEAVPILERAAEVAAGGDAEVRVLAQLGSVLRELQRYDAAERTLRRVLVRAREVDDPREEAAALGVLGAVRMETGDSRAAVELYDRSIACAREIGFRRLEAIGRVNRGIAQYYLSRPVAAGEDHAAALAVFEALGDLRGEAAVRLNRASLRHGLLGDDDGALDDLERALAYFVGADDPRFVALVHETRASIALRRGELVGARRAVEQARSAASQDGGEWAMVQVHERLAAVAIAEGAHELALADARAGILLARRNGADDRLPLLWGLEGEALVGVGESRQAVHVTGRAVGALHDGVERGYRVQLQHHLAAAAVGDQALAARAVASAREALERMVAELPAPDRARALAVPDHRRILEIAESTIASRMISVAAVDAPRGRTLAPEELVEVQVELLPRASTDDPVEHRRRALAHVVAQLRAGGGDPTVEDLAAALQVSPATVRRDLAVLRAAGVEVPTRGHRTA